VLRGTVADLRARGTTVVVIAHDVGFVMDCCDDVYVLAEGSVLAHGRPEVVQRDPAVVDAYLGVPA
jgi:branched-chain amino acid transport system ATP-binding protein